MTRFLTGLAFFATSPALAAQILVSGSETTALPINAQVGSVVQFPFSVRTVTPSTAFVITQLGADLERTTGQPVDVRTFQIRPVPGARKDDVTFVLANGRSVRLSLTALPEAEKFHEVAIPMDAPKVRDARFLGSEISFLRQMILDEGAGVSRTVVDKEIDTVALPNLKARLVRVYASQGLTGYVFTVANQGKQALTLNPALIGMGRPNRAVLAHADSYTLAACSQADMASCATVFRVVLRGAGDAAPQFAPAAQTPGSFPFLKPESRTQDTVGGAP